MGNCNGSKLEASDPSSIDPNKLTKRSTPDNSVNYSEFGTSSAFSSSAAQSRFSAAISEASLPSPGQVLPSSSLKIYSFADLKSATKNFKSDTVLGVGGFGTVFKGWVDEKTLAPSKSGIGTVVAIKKLNSESLQGFEEWQVLVQRFLFSTILWPYVALLVKQEMMKLEVSLVDV